MLTQKELIGKDDLVMPVTKILAFLKEFPIVEDGLEPESISQVYVTRLESSLLNYVPASTANTPCLNWNVYAEEYIYLCDKEGSFLKYKSPIYNKKYRYFGPLIRTEIDDYSIVSGELTLKMIIDLLGESASKIDFIYSYFKPYKSVIVYKLPKNQSIPVWIKAEIQKERELIQKEIDNI